MSHPIDHVFCNPVENSFCGHPHTPRKFLPSSPPIPSGFPLTILVGGGGGWVVMDYFPESHNVYLQALNLSLPSPRDFFTLSPNREPATLPATLEDLERIMATAFWLNIILLQRDLLIKKWLIFSEQNRIRLSSTAFDFVRLVR